MEAAFIYTKCIRLLHVVCSALEESLFHFGDVKPMCFWNILFCKIRSWEYKSEGNFLCSIIT